MKCPKCKFENPNGAKFCNECGRSLIHTSNTAPPTFSFNNKLDEIQRSLPENLSEKILSQKNKIEGERRHVTIMFCDMRGFTPLSEKIGPEETFSLMDQVFDILIQKVNKYEGTVNELMGDGILALFGAPIALEDAPQRALHSALAIHREIKRFNKNIGDNSRIPPVLLRIGINTGPVVVGSVGNDLRVRFTTMGDTVNLASRMESLAEPGTTYVTENTFRLTETFFRFEALGKKVIKGKKEAIPVYKMLYEKPDVYRSRPGSGRIIYSKMVGRDNDLDRLELQVMKAINNEGSIANIIGEAGIGKSRLVTELKRREVMKRVTLLEGRAISTGRNLSFHPVIDIIKQWAQIRMDDEKAIALGKLETAVRSLYPEKMYEVLPFFATLMGMKLSGRYAERVKGIEGEALKKLILKNARELLSKATEQAPLVIIMEDLHWADTSSIELIEYLFRLAETQSVLFINVFRPGYKETGDRIVKTIKERLSTYNIEIVLEPLDKRMSEVLITNILNISGLHPAVIRQVVQRAGGNPFFIEEVMQSFIDERAIILKDGTFHMTEKIDTMAIPHTINEVLMVRIDRLEGKTRNLVKIASVIGRKFFHSILIEVANTVEDIDSRLSYLKEIQLIRERKRMDEVEYLFKHALAQETVYESILPQRRKELHLKVASSIEKVLNKRIHEFYGMLAYHYSRADSMEKSEEYLIKAGEESLKSSASKEALYYYQEALNLYLKKYADKAAPDKVARLEKNIAHALYNRGQYDEAVDFYDKALDYYWGKLPKHAIPAVFKFLSASLHFLITLYAPSLKFRKTPTQMDNETVDLFFKKLKALAIIDPKRFFVESFYFYKRFTRFDLTQFESGLGMFVGASTFFSFTGMSFKLSRKILDFIKGRVEENDINSLTIYDFSETLHNYFEGNWKSIKEYDDDLVNKNLSIGDVYWASQHFFWHGCPKIYQGYFDITKLLVDKLNDLFEVYDNELSMLLKYLLNTSLLMERRELNKALIEIDEGIEFGQRISLGTILIEMYSRKAHIHILMGDIEDAEKSLRLAHEVRREINTVPWQLTDLFRSQFEYELYQLKEAIINGRKREASEYRKKARKSAGKLLKTAAKVAQNRTDSYKLMGVYYWLIKKQKNALKWWYKAIEEGEHLNAHLELSRTYFEIGKHLVGTESKYKALNGVRGGEYLEKAKVLFKDMNLQWDLDELDRVIRG